jgi:SP family sugar:H+ symporter-like MFS transporter
MPYWQDLFSTGYRDSSGHLNVTASQTSAIVSILSAGTFFGALGAAPIADRIGRRWSLIASSCVFIFGVILQTAATAIPLFLAGRFFAGLGVGLVSALSEYPEEYRDNSTDITANISKYPSINLKPHRSGFVDL